MCPAPSVLDLASPRLAARYRGGTFHIEQVLAVGRILLAASSILLVWFHAAEPQPYPKLVLTLLFAYLANAICLSLVLHLRAGNSGLFSVLAHTADLLWPAVINLFVGHPGSPFFLYYIFALLAAAFRWGMRETALTTVGIVFTMAANAVILARTRLGGIIEPVDASRLVNETIYVVIFAFLIGYVAEWEKRRAAQALGISQIATKIRVECGLLATVETIFQDVLRLFGARELVVVVDEAEVGRTVLWQGETQPSGDVAFSWRLLDDNEREHYQITAQPELCAGAWCSGNVVSTITVDEAGRRLKDHEARLSAKFVSGYRFRTLLACAVSTGAPAPARIFLLDPSLGGRTVTQLRCFEDLSHTLTPLVYNVYLLRRLRSRATAVERARVARELHDGVVQSLHAIAFRLYALRIRSSGGASDRQQELLEMQQLVQKESSNVRKLMQQLDPLELDPRQLLDFLSDMVTSYQRDTGIDASFVCDAPEVKLLPATCRELAGILREALDNVRRHSCARHVLVRLLRQSEGWMLVIEDDGRGFGFSGRFPHAELEGFGRGPMFIQQRVRAIGGELTIISKPGQGARLEIRVPDLIRARSA